MSTAAETTTTQSFDKEALRKRYKEEKDKRLRADGAAQYQQMTGKFEHFADDPYAPIAEREPVNDHVTFAFVGGGFAGLVTCARMVEAGVKDVRIIDKGSDFGGVWYWNRYPGIQCDTAAMIYMPLLEETGYMPSRKYVRGEEIHEHCQRIGKHYGLYDNALFQTAVSDLRWDEEKSLWHIKTNRGDDFTATYISLGTGTFPAPKLPGIPGIENFKGHSFHTSRWDYDYTGGDRSGAPMTKLNDKRVAMIGTGATGIQVVPHLATSCEKCYVIQRTPSPVDVRNNEDTDPEWFKEMATEGWQERWLENFAARQSGAMPFMVTKKEPSADVDLVQDGWTDISTRIFDKIAALPADERTPENIHEVWEDSDCERMEEIRARVENIVKDPATAEGLKPWYSQSCKRPCFHDEYLQAFNNPSMELIDTDGKGVEKITETGFVVDGKEYEVDCIIYASGFNPSEFSYKRLSGFEVYGREGKTLTEHWGAGMRTQHGIHAAGFPNMFIIQPCQGAFLLSNFPHNIVDSSKTIASIVRHAIDTDQPTVEVTEEAEAAWVKLIVDGAVADANLGSADCTPSYYNAEGMDIGDFGKTALGFPEGPYAFFNFMKDWRASGKYEGLKFG